MPTIAAESDAATVISVEGRLDGFTTDSSEAIIMAGLASGKGLVLDLSGLSYVASVGLRLILLAAKRSAQSGQSFAVCALQPQIREVFEIAGLDMLVKVCTTRAEAIGSVRG